MDDGVSGLAGPSLHLQELSCLHHLDPLLLRLAVAGHRVGTWRSFVQGDGTEVGVRGVAAVDHEGVGLGVDEEKDENLDPRGVPHDEDGFLQAMGLERTNR